MTPPVAVPIRTGVLVRPSVREFDERAGDELAQCLFAPDVALDDALGLDARAVRDRPSSQQSTRAPSPGFLFTARYHPATIAPQPTQNRRYAVSFAAPACSFLHSG